MDEDASLPNAAIEVGLPEATIHVVHDDWRQSCGWWRRRSCDPRGMQIGALTNVECNTTLLLKGNQILFGQWLGARGPLHECVTVFVREAFVTEISCISGCFRDCFGVSWPPGL